MTYPSPDGAPSRGEPSGGLYLVLISVHGLVRGFDLELGRDADTGGQVKYVVELSRALGRHPRVAQVDLLTRQIVDRRIDTSYAVPEEPLGEGARIVRLPCGPRRYLHKERLWPHLDGFVDQALRHFRRQGRLPDVIHSHYADAGWIGSRLTGLLGMPLVHTGHSLGRIKRQRLIDHGMDPEVAEDRYNLARRIESEEMTLDEASLVITSTRQEVEEQYDRYENYQPERMRVIPPGVDLSRFHPPQPDAAPPAIAAELARFLDHPDRPLLLAVARPDERKNLVSLVEAYGSSQELRRRANLVILAGNREDIAELDRGARRELTRLLVAVDRFDLYGLAAYPKHHQPDDVPDVYRLAARSRGVFVNPALTEPFGLTLIEAAAVGLPVVATEDGGPRDIIANCRCGRLVDPLDVPAIADTILEVLSDGEQWEAYSRSAVEGTRRHYSWEAHVGKYLEALGQLRRPEAPNLLGGAARSRLLGADRLLVCDIDHTLTGDREAAAELARRLREETGRVAFAVATGRSLEGSFEALEEWGLPEPDVLITRVGTEIYYGHPRLVADLGWTRTIDYRWRRDAVREVMEEEIEGLELQGEEAQSRFKISYVLDSDQEPRLGVWRRILRNRGLKARLVFSHGAFIDVLPIRAATGQAVRYVGMRWGIPPERILTAGDSGNDADMLGGDLLGVVVANHSPELEPLHGQERVYFASGRYAAGVLEGIEHYEFFGAIRPGPGRVEEADREP